MGLIHSLQPGDSWCFGFSFGELSCHPFLYTKKCIQTMGNYSVTAEWSSWVRRALHLWQYSLVVFSNAAVIWHTLVVIHSKSTTVKWLWTDCRVSSEVITLHFQLPKMFYYFASHCNICVGFKQGNRIPSQSFSLRYGVPWSSHWRS